ncbi:MAG: galactose mutarotase [Planctomycetia bacterium]|nr:galactose mutarotase [Planctomycetia bacterium]
MSVRAGACLLSACLLLATGCQPEAPPKAAQKPADAAAVQTAKSTTVEEIPGVSRENWGSVEGKEVYLYTLKNRHGLTVKITNWGATVTEVDVPDKDGKLDDVVLGFKTLDGYVKGDGKQSNPAYFGAIIGRYCNRLGDAAFKLEGKSYTLAKNNGKNTLHGGVKGFDKCVWQSETIKTADGGGVKFTLVSPDGDEGFPGAVHAEVTYILKDDNALKIEFQATADKPTPVSLTNHSYFNLSGEGKGTILDHELQLKSDKQTVFDDGGIPTGEIKSVVDTPLDFRQATPIGQRIDQLKGTPGGYDHNYVLSDKKSDTPQVVANVYDPASGRTLELATTEVGVQFYSGNYLDGSLTGKRGAKYEKHGGFCLEPQFFPDSPNKANFPSPILRPGETYRQTTVFRFGVRK